jgi:hypothetical protein
MAQRQPARNRFGAGVDACAATRAAHPRDRFRRRRRRLPPARSRLQPQPRTTATAAAAVADSKCAPRSAPDGGAARLGHGLRAPHFSFDMGWTLPAHFSFDTFLHFTLKIPAAQQQEQQQVHPARHCQLHLLSPAEMARREWLRQHFRAQDRHAVHADHDGHGDRSHEQDCSGGCYDPRKGRSKNPYCT